MSACRIWELKKCCSVKPCLICKNRYHWVVFKNHSQNCKTLQPSVMRNISVGSKKNRFLQKRWHITALNKCRLSSTIWQLMRLRHATKTKANTRSLNCIFLDAPHSFSKCVLLSIYLFCFFFWITVKKVVFLKRRRKDLAYCYNSHNTVNKSGHRVCWLTFNQPASQSDKDSLRCAFHD